MPLNLAKSTCTFPPTPLRRHPGHPVPGWVWELLPVRSSSPLGSMAALGSRTKSMWPDLGHVHCQAGQWGTRMWVMWKVLSQTNLDGREGFGSHLATLGYLLENHSAGSSQHWDPLAGPTLAASSLEVLTQIPTPLRLPPPKCPLLYFPHKLTGGPNG